jgi:hypothetical protein
MNVKLGKIQRRNVRDAWLNEASHFTPWLASDEGLELLQEALEMDLEVEATEQFVGPFKADILAKRTDTTDDHWVLIENQLERTDHRHLGQLLTYAAGLDAATIVWVAERFCEEHRAALDWLNDITSDKFEFFGLEIELWQIGESAAAPMFKLLLERKSAVRPQKAHPQHWADYAIGRSGTWLSATVNSAKKYVSVEFNLRGPPGKIWFDQIQAKQSEIEAKFGPGLSWQRLDGKKQSRIALYREQSDPTAEVEWHAQHLWLAEKLELLHTVFRPIALALIDASGSPLGDNDIEVPALD